jgi:catechol 2,3-dioxygenase-like lactoylglutathione lyase family enzyme
MPEPQPTSILGDLDYPYLRVLSVEVYVRDQDQSLHFYQETLGFRLIADTRLKSGERWIAVGPSEGSAVLALIKPTIDAQGDKIGRQTGVTLATDDIATKFRQWTNQGVRFRLAPTPVPWGIHATFEDLDGNVFNLIQNPVLVETLNAARRVAEERREAERRTAQEMEIAKEVQARLFPQHPPVLRTLDYAGACVPARQVGGDYYDFFELRPGRVALLIVDIAGKGVAGALLMANLQANLRTQYATLAALKEFFPLLLEDFEHLLVSVNRSFYENSGDSSYATLSFAGL